MKDTYSIYEAKSKLSEIIRRVKHRRSVTITDRGVPVARVIPFEREAQQSFTSRIKELQSRGALKLAEESPANIRLLEHRPGSVERFLSEDRDSS